MLGAFRINNRLVLAFFIGYYTKCAQNSSIFAQKIIELKFVRTFGSRNKKICFCDETK